MATLIFLLASCGSDAPPDRLFAAQQESARRALDVVQADSRALLRSVEADLDEPELSERAARAYGPMTRVDSLTGALLGQLAGLQGRVAREGGLRAGDNADGHDVGDLMREQGLAAGLDSALSAYRVALTGIATAAGLPAQELPCIAPVEAAAANTEFGRYYFPTGNVHATLSMLEAFRLHAGTAANRVLRHLKEQAGHALRHGHVDAWVAAEYSTVEPGESLRIAAALGTFPGRVPGMEVRIDGQPATAGADGFFRGVVTAARTPGTHEVPVLIRYYDHDGRLNEISKRVVYRVAR